MIIELNLLDLEILAQIGSLKGEFTEVVNSINLETAAWFMGCGRVARTGKAPNNHGSQPEGEMTVYGRELLVMIDGHTRLCLVAKVVFFRYLRPRKIYVIRNRA